MTELRFVRATVLSATSLLALSAGSNSYAQEPDLIDDDTIVVLGTKQGLTTQEAEVSVDIFNEARLENEALFALDDVLARVPNVVSTGGSGITIRGINRFGVSGQGVTSNVYLDGAPISSLALGVGLDSVWDIAQIEVLKGPQSTVQGRNALAGAVVLRVNDPTYEWETKFRARYASFDTQQYAGVVSGPIIKDELAFRLSADYQSTDSFITNGVTLEDQYARDNLLLRGKLLVEPSSIPDLRAEFTVDYNEGTTGDLGTNVNPRPAFDENGATIPAIRTPEFFAFDFDDFLTFESPVSRDTEILRILTDIEYELNSNLSLQFIGTYEDATSDLSVGDIDDPTRFGGLVGNNSNFTDASIAETYSAELRLYYEYGRWSGSVGGYFFDEFTFNNSVSSSDFAPEVFPFTITPADSINLTSGFNTTDVRNFAFYGQTRFDLNDKWTFDFSIRYDNERFRSPGQDTTPGIIEPASCFVNDVTQGQIDALLPDLGLTVPLTCQAIVDAFTSDSPALPETTTFSAILPRGAITYNVSDDLSVFFTGQRGYRAGGTFTFFSLDGGLTFGEFDPEFLTTYEVGFRSQSLDGDLTFNGNVFYSLYRGQQVSVPGPRGTAVDSRIDNVGSSRLYGAEFQGNYRVTDELTVNASLGLLQAEFQDFPFIAPLDAELAGFTDAAFQNLKGNSFPNTPTVSFNVGADYEHASGFFTNVSVAYTGPRETDIFNLDEDDFTLLQNDFPDELGDLPLDTFTERVGSRVLANARIGYTEDRFSFYVYGTNLLNDNTPISVSGAGVRRDIPVGTNRQDVGISSSGLEPSRTAAQLFGTPRVVGLGLDLKF
ncbi:MAG: TonB-dependent receptor [Pseudomonadota bacterium]